MHGARHRFSALDEGRTKPVHARRGQIAATAVMRRGVFPSERAERRRAAQTQDGQLAVAVEKADCERGRTRTPSRSSPPFEVDLVGRAQPLPLVRALEPDLPTVRTCGRRPLPPPAPGSSRATHRYSSPGLLGLHGRPGLPACVSPWEVRENVRFPKPQVVGSNPAGVASFKALGGRGLWRRSVCARGRKRALSGRATHLATHALRGRGLAESARPGGLDRVASGADR